MLALIDESGVSRRGLWGRVGKGREGKERRVGVGMEGRGTET